MGFKKQFVQLDGTPKTYNTSRQGETFLYITGSGDDLVNGLRGKGAPLKIKGVSTGESKLMVGFLDDIFLKDGILFWNNGMEGDSISVEIVLPANTFFVSPTNTGNYDLDLANNPIPNATNTGSYMMYPIDITVNRFINRFEIQGTNEIGLVIESSDTAFIPKQLQIRLVLTSTSSNPDVSVRFVTEIYRESTV